MSLVLSDLVAALLRGLIVVLEVAGIAGGASLPIAFLARPGVPYNPSFSCLRIFIGAAVSKINKKPLERCFSQEAFLNFCLGKYRLRTVSASFSWQLFSSLACSFLRGTIFPLKGVPTQNRCPIVVGTTMLPQDIEDY